MSVSHDRERAALPLAPMQAEKLRHATLNPGSGAGIIRLVLVLREEVDEAALAGAWDAALRARDAFRVGFRRDGEGGEPRQELLPGRPLPVTRRDVSALDPAERERRFAALLEEDRLLDFDLGAPPLARLLVVRFDAEDWRIVWTFHHVVMDGRSIPPVLEDVFARYDAARTGGASDAPGPAPSYLEYVEWVSRLDHALAEPFWRELFAGLESPSLLGAALGMGSSGAPSTRPAAHNEIETWLGPGPTERLRREAGGDAGALAAWVQAAWAVLLSRYCDRPDAVFGAPRACRRSVPLGRMDERVGLFMNSVAIRVPVRPETSFRDMVGHVRAVHTGAAAHEHTPLSAVRAWSGCASGALFDSVVVFENYDLTDLMRRRCGGAWARRELRIVQQTDVAFTLGAYLGDERMRVELAYDAGAADGPTARRLLDHFMRILEGAIEAPDGAVADLAMLSDDELRLETEAWNATAAPFSSGTTVHALVFERARRTPDATALRFEGEEMPYAELARRAAGVANELRALGVGPGATVGLAAAPSFARVVGMLGVLAAGGAYVPLDAGHPARRVAAACRDARVRAVVGDAASLGALGALGVPRVCADGIAGSALAAGVPLDAGGAGPRDLAYVLFTSGSTGEPKGVCVEHEAVCNMVEAQIQAFGITPQSRVLQLASLGFDASVSEIFTTLVAGATLVLAPAEALAPGPELIRLLRREAVTTLTVAPSALAALPHDALPALETLVVAGEACPPALVRRWAEGRRFLNAYGPCEATVCATVDACDPAEERVTIGRPIRNVRAYVLLRDTTRPPLARAASCTSAAPASRAST